MKTIRTVLTVLSLLLLMSAPLFAQLVFINDNPPFEKQNAAMGDWIKGQIGIGFVPESAPDLANYQTTVRQSLTSPKTAPDFFKWWSHYRMKPLVDAGLLVDVSDIWQKYINNGAWPKSVTSEVTFNGKQYAIPYLTNHWGIIYNKRVFQELGLEVPKTWPQFIALCDKIKASGRTPLAMTLNGRWQSLIWWSEILIKTDPDLYMGIVDGKIKFADPKVLAALKPWLDVIKYFPADETLPWEEVYPKIVSGDCAMDLLGDWLLTSLQSVGADLNKDVGWFPVPPITPKGNGFIYEVSPICIPVNSPNVEKTKKVFDAWMSTEGQKVWVNLMSVSSPAAGGLIPNLDPFTSIKAAGLFTKSVRYMPRWYEAVPVDLVEYSIDKFGEVILDPSKLKSAMTDVDNFRKTM